MRGDNPKRPFVEGDGLQLDIQEIFPTLQGEGPRAGEKAVFVRLGGCNLACAFCDTEFESFNTWQLDEVLAAIDHHAQGQIPLVVITGGEPLRQPLERLCAELLAKGYNVQVETNGMFFRALDGRVEIICSPKNPTGEYAKIRADLLPHINAFKFIVSETDALYRTVPDVGQGDIPVYVQPMDEQDEQKNLNNLAYARALAVKNGYRLSIQLHKQLGLP